MRIGVDLIEIERIARALRPRGGFPRALLHGRRARVLRFSLEPGAALRLRASRARRRSARRSAAASHFTWREIEIAGRPKPGVQLSGRKQAWAERVNAGAIDLSMTHSKELAAAIAVVADPVERAGTALHGG